jgi:hypothetical protein
MEDERSLGIDARAIRRAEERHLVDPAAIRAVSETLRRREEDYLAETKRKQSK